MRSENRRGDVKSKGFRRSEDFGSALRIGSARRHHRRGERGAMGELTTGAMILLCGGGRLILAVSAVFAVVGAKDDLRRRAEGCLKVCGLRACDD